MKLKTLVIITFIAVIGFTISACENAGRPFNAAAGAANIGRTGPGGGIIFYYNEEGFTVYGTYNGIEFFPTYTAHFLEVAPERIEGEYQWSSRSYFIQGLSNAYNGSGINDWVVGRGRLNTAIIISVANRAGVETLAATNAAAYRLGDKDDWFLPSGGELNQLWRQRSIVGIPHDAGNNYGFMWSSSQICCCSAWNLFNASGGESPGFKNWTGPIRPIRAF
jgi:hypothetical protein